MENYERILKQHEHIRGKINVLLDQLETLKKDPSAVDHEVFNHELKAIFQLVDTHSRFEEQVLVPLLKQMYNTSAAELVEYVEGDHKVIEGELNELEECDLNSKESIAKFKSILNHIIIHFEEEERGLIPLVEMFLKSKA